MSAQVAWPRLMSARVWREEIPRFAKDVGFVEAGLVEEPGGGELDLAVGGGVAGDGGLGNRERFGDDGEGGEAGRWGFLKKLPALRVSEEASESEPGRSMPLASRIWRTAW